MAPSCLSLGAVVQPPWRPVQPCEPSEGVNVPAAENRPGPRCCGGGRPRGPLRAGLGGFGFPPVRPAAVSDCGDGHAETVDCDPRGRLVGGRRVGFETDADGEVEKQGEVQSEGEIDGGWRVEEKGDCRGGRGGVGGEEKGGRSRRGPGGVDGDGGGGQGAQAVGGSGGCLVSGLHGRAGQDGVASRASRAQSCG